MPNDALASSKVPIATAEFISQPVIFSRILSSPKKFQSKIPLFRTTSPHTLPSRNASESSMASPLPSLPSNRLNSLIPVSSELAAPCKIFNSPSVIPAKYMAAALKYLSRIPLPTMIAPRLNASNRHGSKSSIDSDGLYMVDYRMRLAIAKKNSAIRLQAVSDANRAALMEEDGFNRVQYGLECASPMSNRSDKSNIIELSHKPMTIKKRLPFAHSELNFANSASAASIESGIGLQSRISPVLTPQAVQEPIYLDDSATDFKHRNEMNFGVDTKTEMSKIENDTKYESSSLTKKRNSFVKSESTNISKIDLKTKINHTSFSYTEILRSPLSQNNHSVSFYPLPEKAISVDSKDIALEPKSEVKSSKPNEPINIRASSILLRKNNEIQEHIEKTQLSNRILKLERDFLLKVMGNKVQVSDTARQELQSLYERELDQLFKEISEDSGALTYELKENVVGRNRSQSAGPSALHRDHRAEALKFTTSVNKETKISSLMKIQSQDSELLLQQDDLKIKDLERELLNLKDQLMLKLDSEMLSENEDEVLKNEINALSLLYNETRKELAIMVDKCEEHHKIILDFTTAQKLYSKDREKFEDAILELSIFKDPSLSEDNVYKTCQILEKRNRELERIIEDAKLNISLLQDQSDSKSDECNETLNRLNDLNDYVRSLEEEITILKSHQEDAVAKPVTESELERENLRLKAALDKCTTQVFDLRDEYQLRLKETEINEAEPLKSQCNMGNIERQSKENLMIENIQLTDKSNDASKRISELREELRSQIECQNESGQSMKLENKSLYEKLEECKIEISNLKQQISCHLEILQSSSLTTLHQELSAVPEQGESMAINIANANLSTSLSIANWEIKKLEFQVDYYAQKNGFAKMEKTSDFTYLLK